MINVLLCKPFCIGFFYSLERTSDRRPFFIVHNSYFCVLFPSILSVRVYYLYISVFIIRKCNKIFSI